MMLGSAKDRAIKTATKLIRANAPAIEFAERLMRCQHEAYRGLNIFVEDLNECSTYFVIDGSYNTLLTSDTAESGTIAWLAAKQWVRDFHASENEGD